MDGYGNHNQPGTVPQAVRPAAPRPATPNSSSNNSARSRGRSPKKLWFWIGGIVIVVALLVAAYLLFFNPDKVNSSRYQAVFLSNGQVYFGKLHSFYGEHPYLTDVYYIQGQNDSSGDKTTSATNSSQLIKLGEEVHNPENMMILNKSSILFVENLKSDSQVAKLIESNDKNGSNSTQSSAPATNAPTTPAPSQDTTKPNSSDKNK